MALSKSLNELFIRWTGDIFAVGLGLPLKAGNHR